jgi:catalase
MVFFMEFLDSRCSLPHNCYGAGMTKNGKFGHFEVTQDVSAYTKRKGDDEFRQPGTLVRKVMDDAQRDRLVSNVVGALK